MIIGLYRKILGMLGCAVPGQARWRLEKNGPAAGAVPALWLFAYFIISICPMDGCGTSALEMALTPSPT